MSERLGPTAASGDDDRASTSAVVTAVETIRVMIREGVLLPGEPVRQQDMARRLGMSRVPIREALHALKTEGLLSHHTNRGYFVARWSAEQLQQIYMMRGLLETELLRRLVWPDSHQLIAIKAINDDLARAVADRDVVAVAQLNRRFHDAIFELSPLETVRQEINRLWEMSDSYRALYLAGPSRYRTVAEHEEMIQALRRRDLDGLLDALDRHRAGALEELVALLGARPAAAAA